MAYAVGVGLALAVCLWATWIGLDRDRAFYPTVMMVIASYYGLFAVLSGSARTLILESVFITAAAYLAWRLSDGSPVDPCERR